MHVSLEIQTTTVVLEKTLESPLDCKEIQPVHLKEISPEYSLAGLMLAGWHHQLDGREFECTPGVGDGQGGLACCSSWGPKESDTTEQLN